MSQQITRGTWRSWWKNLAVSSNGEYARGRCISACASAVGRKQEPSGSFPSFIAANHTCYLEIGFSQFLATVNSQRQGFFNLRVTRRQEARTFWIRSDAESLLVDSPGGCFSQFLAKCQP